MLLILFRGACERPPQLIAKLQCYKFLEKVTLWWEYFCGNEMSHVEKQICSKQARPTKKRVLSVFIRTRLLNDTCFFWTDLKTLFIPVWTHLRRSWVSRSPGVPLSLSCQFSLHLSNKDKNIFKKRTESLDAASHLIVFLYFHKYLHCSRHHNVELNQKV